MRSLHRTPTLWLLLCVAAAGLLGCTERAACDAPAGGPATDWPHYGNDPGGARFSPLADVTPENVHCLEAAWEFRTGDLATSRGEHSSKLASEVTPVL